MNLLWNGQTRGSAPTPQLSTLNSPLDPQGRFQSEAGKELSYSTPALATK